jgi:hypothetical protein
MPERAEQCLVNAERAEAEAARMTLSTTRQQLLDIPRRWRELARQAADLATFEAESGRAQANPPAADPPG